MSNNCAIILAGGQGKRMKTELPKPLLKVLGEPMLQWVVRACEDSEYSEDSITGLLSALLSPTMPLERRMEILSGIYRIAMTEEIEREVTKVCSLGDAIKEAGREEGIIEGQVKSLTKFIDNGRITVDEAATSVNMTVEDFLKKREEIEKKSSF